LILTKTQLDSVSTIIDCEHKTAPATQKEVFAFSVGTKALSDNFINVDACKPVDEMTFREWSKRAEIEQGDIILAREAPVGGVGLVKFEHPRLCLGQRTVLIKPDRNVINPTFLNYLLQSHEVQTWFAEMSSGSTVLHLNVADIKKLPLKNLPGIKIQESIASVLQNIELKIESNKILANLLEEFAQSLFKSWFIDFDPIKAKANNEKPVGMNDETAALFPDSFEESELGLIPKEWTVRTIGSLCDVLLGGTPSRARPDYWNGNIPWINSGKVKEFRILKPSEYISEAGLINSATKLLPSGTTIIGITGYIWFTRLEIATCGNQSIIGIPGSVKASDEFIFLNIKNNIHQLISLQTGTAQQHINREDVKSYKIIYPGQELVDIFTSKVKDMFFEIGNLLKQNVELEALKDALLPRLISGELQIPEEMLAS
jgi:type I restriction enzyme S subunit